MHFVNVFITEIWHFVTLLSCRLFLAISFLFSVSLCSSWFFWLRLSPCHYQIGLYIKWALHRQINFPHNQRIIWTLSRKLHHIIEIINNSTYYIDQSECTKKNHMIFFHCSKSWSLYNGHVQMWILDNDRNTFLGAYAPKNHTIFLLNKKALDISCARLCWMVKW